MAMSPQEEQAFLNGDWVAVASSNVVQAMYEEEGERFYLRYKDGKTYQYLGIGREMAQSFARASSFGSWVWDNLKIRGTRDGSKVTFIGPY